MHVCALCLEFAYVGCVLRRGKERILDVLSHLCCPCLQVYFRWSLASFVWGGFPELHRSRGFVSMCTECGITHYSLCFRKLPRNEIVTVSPSTFSKNKKLQILWVVCTNFKVVYDACLFCSETLPTMKLQWSSLEHSEILQFWINCNFSLAQG